MNLLGLATRIAFVLSLVAFAGACGTKHVDRGNASTHASTPLVNPPTPSTPLPPPPKAALPTPSGDGVYESGGLRYLVSLLGGARADEALPLVVDLHSHSGTPDRERQVEHLNRIHERARAVFIFGLHRTETGFEWMPGGISHSDQYGALTRDLPSVAAKVDYGIRMIAAAWPTIGKPVVAGGSQGGTVAYGLALLYPNDFSWVCPIAGQLPPQLIAVARPHAPLPEVHGFQGAVDQTVDVRDARRTIQSMQKLGYVADLREFRGVGHELVTTAAPELDGCVAHGIRRCAEPTAASAPR